MPLKLQRLLLRRLNEGNSLTLSSCCKSCDLKDNIFRTAFFDFSEIFKNYTFEKALFSSRRAFLMR